MSTSELTDCLLYYIRITHYLFVGIVISSSLVKFLLARIIYEATDKSISQLLFKEIVT